MPELRLVRLDDPVAAALVTASVAEMASLYGGQPGSGPPPRAVDFAPPDGTFLVASLEGEAVGCGGLSRLTGQTAEVRRMYVAPPARGRGVAKAILAGLLEAARELGYREVRLETGRRQVEAIGLYTGAGFRPCECWSPYVEDPRSCCYRLEL